MKAFELKRKTFQSVIWTVARVGSTNVVTFVAFFILARRLTPVDLGIYGLAFLCTDLAKTLTTAGLEEMITQTPQLDEELADSAFWFAVLISIALCGALWAGAGVYARLTDEPAVAPVIRWLCVVIPISALGVLHMGRKLREFGHRVVAAQSMACGLLGGGSGIVAIIYGLGIWSFVIQAIVTEVFGAVFSWVAFPWLPRLRLSVSRLREVASFTGGATIALLLKKLQARSQELIIGSLLGAAPLGTFRIAARMLEVISQLTVFPVMSVSLVTLARLQHDPPAFANAYRRMLGLMAVITLPAIAGFGVLAHPLILTLLGARWEGAVPIAEILAGAAVPLSFSYFVMPTLISAGRTRASVEVSVVQFVLMIAVIGFAVPFGLAAVAVASVVRGYLLMPYQIWVLQRETDITPSVVADALLPPLRASLFMVVVLLALYPVLQQYFGAPPARALVGTLAGIAIYLVGLLLFSRRFLVSQYAVLRPLIALGSN